MRSARDWLYRQLDPARRKLAILGLVLCVPMAILWIGARIAYHEPYDDRLLLLSMLGQAGFTLGPACLLLAFENRAFRWLGALLFVFGVWTAGAGVILYVTGLRPG